MKTSLTVLLKFIHHIKSTFQQGSQTSHAILVIYELNFESIFTNGINLKLQGIIRIFQATRIK